MIDCFDLYQDLNGHVIAQQGGIIRLNSTYMPWLRDIEMELINELKKQFEVSQVISDELTPFLLSKPVAVKPAPGENHDIAVLPPDYDFFCAARKKTRPDTEGELYELDEQDAIKARINADANISIGRITKVTNNRWSAVMERRRNRPTMAKPVCTQFEGGLKIAPKGVGMIQLDYLRKPRPATLVYTIINPATENEYIQYNKAASLPLEWNESLRPVFLQRLKDKYFAALTGKYQ